MRRLLTLRPILKRLLWFWPVGLLLLAWIIAPIRARSDYPGLTCTADAASFYEQLSYLALFLPTAVLLFFVTRLLRRLWVHRRWRLALIGIAVVVSVLFLGIGGVLAAPNDEQSAACPAATSSFRPIRCWKGADLFEMNAIARRPSSVQALAQLASSLASVKPDVSTYEAFLLDTDSPSIANYSNGRLFVLQHLGIFGSGCTAHRRPQKP